MKLHVKQKFRTTLRVKSFLTALSVFSLIAVSLFHSETLAANLCSQVFTLSPSSNTQAGAQFLHHQDPRLHISSPVEKTALRFKRIHNKTLMKPAEKIDQWLEFLNRTSEKASKSPRSEAVLKEVLYKQFITTKEGVPESYYNQQIQLARNRGHGDIILSREQKIQLAESIVLDQKKSLDMWTEYLISKDTQMYPMWLKYWMFSGMTKLSKYDIQIGSFGNRSKETVAPFADLNREALAYVADLVLKKINKQSLHEIRDPEFLRLLEGMNFGKLYGKTLLKLGVGVNGKFHSNEGRWVVYSKGSDHMPLVQSLAGQNTGWCTAGEATAQSQLSKGDFHVFYSFDQKGKATIPRVAIRMEETEIGEVRGVSKDQNLDSQILQSAVVSKKMREFGEQGKEYKKKEQDMQHLTEIETKHKLGQQISIKEMRFLYEMDSSINGFGYSTDPRIEKIKSQRDIKDDLVIIYNNKFRRNEISLTDKEAFSGKFKMHYGNIKLSDVNSTKNLKFIETLNGNLYLSELTSAKGLTLPKTLNGDLYLSGLFSANGLKLPETLSGDLHLGNLTSAKGLKLPKTVHGSLNLESLNSVEGLKLPEIVNGNIILHNLTSADGLNFPQQVNGGIFLNQLTSAIGLRLPQTLNGNLNLNRLISAKDLQLPETLNGNLYLGSLTSVKDLILPKTFKKLYMKE